MHEFKSKIIKTDVTCVKCLAKYIFAGIGGNLHVFEENGKFIQLFNVFPAQRIYGIVPNKTNNIAVFGGNKIKIIEFNFLSSNITSSLFSKECEDWILDVRWINNDENIAVMFANNYVSCWMSKHLNVIQNVGCEQRCLLYSATLVNDTWENLYVFSGTIFSEVLLWKPAENPFFSSVLCTLRGHNGVIFSINYNKELNLIITTSDDRTLRFWNAENIFSGEINELSPLKTLYGHQARVFRSLVINDKVVSAGEDSNIFVWNLEGKLVRKYESHQNGCIWALDKTQTGQLVSGGGDSGVSVYPFDVNFQAKELTVEEDETPKTIKILGSGNIVMINEKGVLKLYDQQAWTIIDVLDDLKSYVVMELSKCRKYLALGGFKGSIYLYYEENNSLLKILTTSSTDLSRIYSIHWLTSEMLLTSENNGKMQLWKFTVKDKTVSESVEEFLLPPSKERWATSATLLHENYIAVGDRKGSIHIYCCGSVEAVQSIKKAHSHLGITGLFSEKNQLISLGRNGILKKFIFDTEKYLTQISNDKLPFSWLAEFFYQKDIPILLGFSGSNFLLWDHKNRRVLYEINCGGGHRSWDFYIDKFANVNFVFIKEKIIHNFSCNLLNIMSDSLVDGCHTKEINAVVMLPLNQDNLLVISGGEDTTLRLSKIDLRLGTTNFKSVNILKAHLSSVRCIKMYPIDNNNYLIISAGGRAQIIIWKLKYEICNGSFEVMCNETDSYYKNLEESESEIRIMDAVILPFETYKRLIVGCSDGTLRTYKINELFKLEYMCTITYALKCIMKLEYIKICSRDIIISMGSDGVLVFWDFSDLCTISSNENLKPFYKLPTHQSSITSFSYKAMSENLFMFLTGGDDNTLNLNVVSFDFLDNNFNVKTICGYSNAKLHGAQITGVYIYENFIICTSIDQNISLLEYAFIENTLKCKLLKQYSSVIADIQGLNCIINDKDDLNICIYGKGLEIVNVRLKR